MILPPRIAWSQASFWVPTGPAEFIEPSQLGLNEALRTRDEYESFARRVASRAVFVPIRELPTEVSRDVLFGINYIVRHKNCGFIVDGTPERGYVLYADTNADGSLRDESPLRFERRDPYYTTIVETSYSEAHNGETYRHDVWTRFVIGQCQLALPLASLAGPPMRARFVEGSCSSPEAHCVRSSRP